MTVGNIIKNRTHPIVMELQGIIGAGKTTVLHKCLLPTLSKMGYKVCVIDEPVEEMEKGGLLEKFYTNPKQYSFRLQIKFFTERLLKCRDLYYKYKDDADIIILERSILSDVHFVNLLRKNGDMSEDEANDYMRWWGLWSELIPFKPDIMFMVSAPLDICMQRISSRNRDGESGISKEYQQGLLNEYNSKRSDNYYNVSDNYTIPCYDIDSTKDYINNPITGKSVVDDIISKMKKIN